VGPLLHDPTVEVSQCKVLRKQESSSFTGPRCCSCSIKYVRAQKHADTHTHTIQTTPAKSAAELEGSHVTTTKKRHREQTHDPTVEGFTVQSGQSIFFQRSLVPFAKRECIYGKDLDAFALGSLFPCAFLFFWPPLLALRLPRPDICF